MPIHIVLGLSIDLKAILELDPICFSAFRCKVQFIDFVTVLLLEQNKPTIHVALCKN